MADQGTTGLKRLFNAIGYSTAGFAAAYKNEAAFRQELLLIVMLLPVAIWFGESTIEIILLSSSLLLILIALYFLLSPQVGEEDAQQRLGSLSFALTVGFGVGFYDGFFGPGTGSFFAIGFVSLMGFGLTKATAHTKVLNLTSNLASLLFFIVGGQVVWTLGLVMAVGQLIGGRLGATMVVLKGSRLIKPLVVVICILMSLKLLLA